MAPRLSKFSRRTQAEAVAASLSGGYLDIFDGEMPASPDEPARGSRLASLRLGDFADLRAPARDGVGETNGWARFFRLFRSDHVTAVLDGTVGTRDADLIVSVLFIGEGSPVTVPSVELGA